MLQSFIDVSDVVDAMSNQNKLESPDMKMLKELGGHAAYERLLGHFST